MDVSTCLNAASPLVLPITYNPVSVDGGGSVRGVAIALGDPSQFFSMKPSVTFNNTFVFTTSQCAPSNLSCIAGHGGTYSPATSAIRSNDYNSWNGTMGRDIQLLGSVYYNDRLSIAGDTVPGFPFFSWTTSNDADQAGLGMGRNSSLLKAATDLDLIPSKQWSYWAGDGATSGHVILGGYDENRVDGQFTTFKMVPPTALWTSATNIQWISSSGNVTSLLADTTYTSLNIVIDPYYDFIELPSALGDTFERTTNSSYDPVTNLFVYASRPAGRLDVTLSNGMVISISSSELFNNGLSYDATGYPNTSTYNFWRSEIIETTDYPDYPLRFGKTFLGSRYLVVDWDNALYHMADSVQGTISSSNIKPLCSGLPDTPTPHPGPTPSPVPRHKPNAAAIGGGVGGGVGFLIICLLAFFFVRRKRQQAIKGGSSEPAEKSDSNNTPSHPPPRYVSGVPAAGMTTAAKAPNTTTNIANTNTSDTSSTWAPSQATSGPMSTAGGAPTSPRSEVSYTSRGHEAYSERGHQAYSEMPTERY